MPMPSRNVSGKIQKVRNRLEDVMRASIRLERECERAGDVDSALRLRQNMAHLQAQQIRLFVFEIETYPASKIPASAGDRLLTGFAEEAAGFPREAETVEDILKLTDTCNRLISRMEEDIP